MLHIYIKVLLQKSRHQFIPKNLIKQTASSMQLVLEPHGFELGRVHLYTDFFSSRYCQYTVCSLLSPGCRIVKLEYVRGCGAELQFILDFPLPQRKCQCLLTPTLFTNWVPVSHPGDPCVTISPLNNGKDWVYALTFWIITKLLILFYVDPHYLNKLKLSQST